MICVSAVIIKSSSTSLAIIYLDGAFSNYKNVSPSASHGVLNIPFNHVSFTSQSINASLTKNV